MRWSVILLIALGIAAAACAAVLVAVARMGNREIVTLKPAAAPEVTIVVAAVPMDAYSEVSKDMIRTKVVPSREAPLGAITSAEQAIGNLLCRHVMENEPLTANDFLKEDDVREITKEIRDGMRVVTLNLPRSASLDTLLYPGSVVDVLASFKMPATDTGKPEPMSNVLLERVRVLAVDERTVNSPLPEKPEKSPAVKTTPRPTQTVALLVRSGEAQILQLAMNNGSVSLALRNPRDKVKAQEGATGLDWLLAHRFPERSRDPETLPATAPAPPPAPVPVVPVAPTTAATKPAPPAPEPRWEVTIIRGTQKETQTFPLPENLKPLP